MRFNTLTPEESREEYSELEINIHLELPMEQKLEMLLEVDPERYIFQDYLERDMERQKQQEQEDLARMFQSRIP